MIRFNCDYSEGAHPQVLQRLVETNMEQTAGYGEDPHCAHAAELIRSECGRPDADVHFLVGGTQANLTVIAAALRPHQGVIAAQSGHVNVHESGAIEATGHKVLAQPCQDGKLTAEQVRQVVEDHFNDETQEHMVQPKMVYISHPTEVGTLYTKEELEALHQVCRQKGLYLFLDGARLGYGLTAPGTDVTMADVAALCDVFYIGGTKVGALLGEAVVIPNLAIQRDFRYMVKRMGGMLAKGRLLGIQFEVLFEDGLYFQLGRQAVEQARRIRDTFQDCGVEMAFDSPTNQQFPVLTREQREALARKYSFNHWADLEDGRSVVRFCTSWATTPQAVEELCRDIHAICGNA